MYIIVVYDMPQNKTTWIHKMLKKRLNWIQNSVFEWELSESEFVKLKWEIKKIISKLKSDWHMGSVIIFNMPYKGALERQVFGEEKVPIDNFV